ncbi:hypothetical protein FRC10_005523 [Ceratobasidium sp. 414]|nr:hypothetical protein FRC10_005523 [Ceratobasidium sp. 414]
MVDSKAGTVVGDYSLSEFPPEREIADLTSRPDFFSKLVKLLTLAKCRNDKAFDDTRRSTDLVATGDAHGCSPVAVALDDASKSTDTLRSSSESDAPVPALGSYALPHDPFERAMPERVARSPSVLRNRDKRERKYARRKGRSNNPPLLEPTTTLTTILETAPAAEPNSPLLHLSLTSTEHSTTEDALMDSDSSRARAAIALARAQLEHSRPASIYRKRERAANRLMMLPGEYEEYLATQTSPVPIEEIITSDFGELLNPDADTMRRAVQQSRSMVLTLMAAREAVSLRTESRKSTHPGAGTISTISLLKESAPFPELYKPGDTPLCPPPSIPLPQVPPLAPTPISPGRDRSRRSKTSPCNNVSGGLPTEYDGNALRRVDTLIQDLLESRPESATSRKRSHSSASSSSLCKKLVDTRLDYDAGYLQQWVFHFTDNAHS